MKKLFLLLLFFLIKSNLISQNQSQYMVECDPKEAFEKLQGCLDNYFIPDVNDLVNNGKGAEVNNILQNTIFDSLDFSYNNINNYLNQGYVFNQFNFDTCFMLRVPTNCLDTSLLPNDYSRILVCKDSFGKFKYTKIKETIETDPSNYEVCILNKFGFNKNLHLYYEHPSNEYYNDPYFVENMNNYYDMETFVYDSINNLMIKKKYLTSSEDDGMRNDFEVDCDPCIEDFLEDYIQKKYDSMPFEDCQVNCNIEINNLNNGTCNLFPNISGNGKIKIEWYCGSTYLGSNSNFCPPVNMLDPKSSFFGAQTICLKVINYMPNGDTCSSYCCLSLCLNVIEPEGLEFKSAKFNDANSVNTKITIKNGKLNISQLPPNEKFSIQIYTIDGKLHLNKNLYFSQPNTAFDLSIPYNLEKEILIIKINNFEPALIRIQNN